MSNNPYLVKPNLQAMGYCHYCGDRTRGLFCNGTCSTTYFGTIRMHARELMDASIDMDCPCCGLTFKQTDFRAPNGQLRACCSHCADSGAYRKVAGRRAGDTHKAIAQRKALVIASLLSVGGDDTMFQGLWKGRGVDANYAPLR